MTGDVHPEQPQVISESEKGRSTSVASRSNRSHRSRRRTTEDASHHSGQVEDARSPSIAHISLPPSEEELSVPARVYSPFAPEVIALLMPSSVFGALARLGIQALVNYDGAAIFPLAWVQAAGCFFMGVAVSLKGEIGD
jgi:fluoride exporter